MTIKKDIFLKYTERMLYLVLMTGCLLLGNGSCTVTTDGQTTDPPSTPAPTTDVATQIPNMQLLATTIPIESIIESTPTLPLIGLEVGNNQESNTTLPYLRIGKIDESGEFKFKGMGTPFKTRNIINITDLGTESYQEVHILTAQHLNMPEDYGGDVTVIEFQGNLYPIEALIELPQEVDIDIMIAKVRIPNEISVPVIPLAKTQASEPQNVQYMSKEGIRVTGSTFAREHCMSAQEESCFLNDPIDPNDQETAILKEQIIAEGNFSTCQSDSSLVGKLVPLTSGNSGTGVVNANGELVGVAVSSSGDGHVCQPNHMVPVNLQIIKDLFGDKAYFLN